MAASHACARVGRHLGAERRHILVPGLGVTWGVAVAASHACARVGRHLGGCGGGVTYLCPGWTSLGGGGEGGRRHIIIC